MQITEEVFLQEIVPELPQGKHIQEENARNWYQSVMKHDPERLEWHVARLKGLGGSDIGEVVCWKLGVPAQFSTVRDIVKQKLMMVPIEEGTPHMRRGHLMEPVIQEVFCEDFGAVSRKDLCAAIDNQVSAEHPWMRGNVDDVLEMMGRIYIGDYKCPVKIGSDASLAYAGQIHQYDFLLKEAVGFGADSLLVIQWDHAKGVAVPVEIDKDPIILQAVLEGGDEIWQHVLTGTLPELDPYKQDDLKYSDKEAAEIASLEERFIRYKLLADQATEKLKQVQVQLDEKLQREDMVLKGQKFPLEVLTTSVRQTLEEADFEQMLHDTGADAQEFMVTDKKLDTEKMIGRLVELGEDPADYFAQKVNIGKVVNYCQEKGIKPPISETVSPSLRANKKSLDKEALGVAKKSAGELIDSARDHVDLGDEDAEEQHFAEMASPSAA